MTGLNLGSGAWVPAIVSVGVDIAIKGTLLLICAHLLNWLLGQRRTLARSAMWNACVPSCWSL